LVDERRRGKKKRKEVEEERRRGKKERKEQRDERRGVKKRKEEEEERKEEGKRKEERERSSSSHRLSLFPTPHGSLPQSATWPFNAETPWPSTARSTWMSPVLPVKTAMPRSWRRRRCSAANPSVTVTTVAERGLKMPAAIATTREYSTWVSRRLCFGLTPFVLWSHAVCAMSVITF
jgi:hypothetical protein